MNKKEILITITCIEVILLLITIVTFIFTFKFSVRLVLENMVNKWVPMESTIAEEYNIDLMFSLIAINIIASIALVIVNIIRLILIKTKYKIMFIIGIAILIPAFGLYYNSNRGTVENILFLSAVLISLFEIIHSHKLGTEYDDKDEIKYS